MRYVFGLGIVFSSSRLLNYIRVLGGLSFLLVASSVTTESKSIDVFL